MGQLASLHSEPHCILSGKKGKERVRIPIFEHLLSIKNRIRGFAKIAWLVTTAWQVDAPVSQMEKMRLRKTKQPVWNCLVSGSAGLECRPVSLHRPCSTVSPQGRQGQCVGAEWRRATQYQETQVRGSGFIGQGRLECTAVTKRPWNLSSLI